ncbi:MAG: TIGR01244 family phosphatase [Porticoccaceae bacterium]|jgi:sulfide:quinone oxidoreductase|nr:TIGR01244 family phosphatase [Porticoccaceae bacterium]
MIGKSLTPRLAVASQITPADVAQIAAEGYAVIINNRPDGEEPGQPTAAEVETAARAAGLSYVHQPVVGANITPADVETFGRLIEATPGKILAHCRTGTRCTMLWLLSQAGKQPADALLARAREAGYDLEVLRPRLEG